MSRIDRRIIQEIMNRIDIEDAIQHYTGDHFRNGKIRCPFHGDNEPSLSVKDGRFRCWSCDASGSVIDFIMRLYGLNFREAVQKLNNDYNLGLQLEQTRENRKADPMEKALREFPEQRRREILACIDERKEDNCFLSSLYYQKMKSGCRGEILDIIENQIEVNLDEIRFLQGA